MTKSGYEKQNQHFQFWKRFFLGYFTKEKEMTILQILKTNYFVFVYQSNNEKYCKISNETEKIWNW